MNLTLWELQVEIWVETWELIYVKDISEADSMLSALNNEDLLRKKILIELTDWAEFSPNHSKWSIISFLKNFWHANEKAMHYQILKRW